METEDYARLLQECIDALPPDIGSPLRMMILSASQAHGNTIGYWASLQKAAPRSRLKGSLTRSHRRALKISRAWDTILSETYSTGSARLAREIGRLRRLANP